MRVVADQATSLRSPITITDRAGLSSEFATSINSASRSAEVGFSVGLGGAGCTQCSCTRRPERSLTAAQAVLASTLKLKDVSAADFDAVFYPGGHGPLWDLAEDATSIALIEAMLKANKPVAAVCHAPAVLRHTKTGDGVFVVKGKNVTGFTNTEEEAAGLTKVVPFLVEDMLTQNGGVYSKAADWHPHVVTDGLLITGQNPASSEPAAKALLKALA